MPISRESEDTITFELNISEAACIYTMLRCADFPNNADFLSAMYYDLQSKLGRNIQSLDPNRIFTRPPRFEPRAMEYIKQLVDEELV